MQNITVSSSIGMVSWWKQKVQGFLKHSRKLKYSKPAGFQMYSTVLFSKNLKVSVIARAAPYWKVDIRFKFYIDLSYLVGHKYVRVI